MITYTSIVGDASQPDVAKALHALDHLGQLDTITLGSDDIRRHRLRVRTALGTECGIALERHTHLYDGAVLRLDADGAVVVRTRQTRWLRVAPGDADAALELGYFAGNMHWAVRFEPGALAIALKGDVDDYRARLAPLLQGGRIREISVADGEPPGGQQGSHEAGHTHQVVSAVAHQHAHEHPHDHDHQHA